MARQKELDGIKREQIEEIDAAAEQYVKARDERMLLTKEEVQARDALVAVMRKHRKKVYKDAAAVPPLVVTLTEGKVSVKVKSDGIPVGDPEGDDPDESAF